MIVSTFHRRPRFRYYGTTKILVPTKGWGPFRYDWYSICSEHQEMDPFCANCNHGYWSNSWKNLIGDIVYDLSPKLWLWWANRKH